VSANPSIGRLRHRVTVEQPVTTDDGGGGATTNWSPVATLWGAIEPASAAEIDAYDRLEGRITHRVVIRHRSDVAGGMRLTHEGRVFRILVVHDPDETGRWSETLAEEEGR